MNTSNMYNTQESPIKHSVLGRPLMSRCRSHAAIKRSSRAESSSFRVRGVSVSNRRKKDNRLLKVCLKCYILYSNIEE